MQKTTIDRRSLPYFSPLSNDLCYDSHKLDQFAQFASNLSDFEVKIEAKKKFETNKRSCLLEVLKEQYEKLNLSPLISKQLEKLGEATTFTVCTGHQLNLLGGPAFFLYKILHTIRLAEQLKDKYPQYHFVPVYWLASEDHDFEEINHLNLFRQHLTWGIEQGGAVGRYSLTDWESFQAEINELFQRFPEAEVHQLIEKYEGKTLGKASFNFVHELFQAYGLVIINADHPKLKQEFQALMVKEINEQPTEKAVLETNVKLEELGYKPQVFVRPINLFYLGQNIRERIVFENDVFTLKSGESKSKTQLLEELSRHPERFSPNALLRPLFQETILPNLAYVGGGGEIAYWLQLKGVFESFHVPMPLLQIRNSVQFIDASSQKRAEKLGFSSLDLFKSLEELNQSYLDRNNQNAPNDNALIAATDILKREVESLILNQQANMQSFVEAEKSKLDKQMESISQKVQKMHKQQFDTALKQLEDLKTRLFPNNGLQERHDHFLNFCPDGNYTEFIKELHAQIDPFENDLLVLELD